LEIVTIVGKTKLPGLSRGRGVGGGSLKGAHGQYGVLGPAYECGGP